MTIESTSEVEGSEQTKWVKNISSKTLTPSQIKLLEKGAGFVISPKEIPINSYIIGTEMACKNLHPGVAAALRVEIMGILKTEKRTVSNITKEEKTAMKKLNEDESIIIVPADKGKCLVIMDKSDYIGKIEEKLLDQETYKQLQKDPSSMIKNYIK